MKTGKKCGKNTTDQDSEPYIKVTRMERGWGVRLFKANGTLHSQDIAKHKSKIGPVCRQLLRWWDKCMGPYSKYADRARHRSGEKNIPGNTAWNQKHIPNEKH